MNIWFTSDTHFGHKNLVRGTSLWGTKPDGTVDTAVLDKETRNFNTIDHMNQTMVNNINKVVGENDTLWHLGDWSFGGFENIKKFRDQLICKNIHLILGNHDKDIAKNHKNIQEIFSSVSSIWGIGWEPKKIARQRMTLCHFPMAVWYNHHKGAWHLHGHSHGNFKQTGNRKILDVGIDNHPEFRPFHLGEIQKIMDSKTIVFVDHHQER